MNSAEFSLVVVHVDRPEKEKTVHFVCSFETEDDMYDETLYGDIPVDDMLSRWYPDYEYVSGPDFIRALTDEDLKDVKDLATIDLTKLDPESENPENSEDEDSLERELEGEDEDPEGPEGEEED